MWGQIVKGQDAEILNELQNEADFFGVFLKSMRTKERFIKRSGMRLKEVSLIMEMESDYDALKNFIASQNIKIFSSLPLQVIELPLK